MLAKKRVLFICTPFHEYPAKIKAAIESINGTVDLFFIEQRSFLSTFLRNVNPALYKRFRKRQHERILRKTKPIHYDYIFIQYPYLLSHDFFKNLKIDQPAAKSINYNWDSIEARDFTPYIKYFDKVFSFDYHDCLSNSVIHYLPLFFTDDFSPRPEKHKKYDLIFIGGIGDSENRYEFVESVEKICRNDGIRFHKYLYCPFNFYVKSLLKGKVYRGVSFKKLPLAKVAAFYQGSECVIDYQNPKQKGFTMRTFEVLGSGCKLITTNKNVLSAAFMNTELICTIEKNKPELSIDFIKNRTSGIYSFDDYSLNSWIKQIFKN